MYRYAPVITSPRCAGTKPIERPRLTRAHTEIVKLAKLSPKITQGGATESPVVANLPKMKSQYVAAKASSQNNGCGVTRLGARRTSMVATSRIKLELATIHTGSSPKFRISLRRE